MPNFYFHLSDGVDKIDEEGTFYPDDASAQLAAVQFGGAMLRDHAGQFRDQREWRLDVTDRRGRLVLGLRFEVYHSPVRLVPTEPVIVSA